MPPPVSADRNLLFGILALQMDYLSRDQLIEAMNAWVLEKRAPLDELLRRRGWLGDEDHALLRRLVERHIERHGGDAGQSLAAVGLTPELRNGLTAATRDPDVLGSLAPLADVPPTSASLPSDTPAGSRYRKLRPHARGGLGEVAVALDTELHREVALKEIQPAHADQPASRARFVREAEVTGQLEHPGIVPVYGLGSYPDGRPYYAMRFIRGETLHDAIARFHLADEGRRDPGERGLALRELLGRFVAVCNAVGYAHSRGVIHRDLKPANVMLGEYGETLVVDWGLAKALDEADATGTLAERPLQLGGSGAATEAGRALGTPAFMPPEQARGRVDQVGTHSDLWALGAMLYHLLTGRAPYVGESALQQAERGEVLPPRQVKASVPRALEAVCGKAMALRPEGRYATARELAREVELWLADEPVRAFRDPLWEQMRRWGRRRRTLVTSAVVLLLASVVGLGAGLYAVGQEKAKTETALEQSETNFAQASANLDRAIKAEAEAKGNLALAEGNLKLAKRAVDETFGVARGHDLLQGEGMREVRRLLFEKAQPFYRDFRVQRPDDPALLREAATQVFNWALIEAEIGSQERALGEYDRARDMFTRLLASSGATSSDREWLARIENNRALILDSLGRYDLARRAYESTRDLYTRLRAESPRSPLRHRDVASSGLNLGSFLARRGQREEGLRLILQARKEQAALVAHYPQEPEWKDELAGMNGNVGRIYVELRRLPQALEALQEARRLRAELLATAPDSSHLRATLAVILTNLGELHLEMNQNQAALKLFEQSRDLLSSAVVAQPRVAAYRYSLANSLNSIASSLHQLRRVEDALGAAQKAHAAFAELVRRHPGVAKHQAGLGMAAIMHGEMARLNRRPGEALVALQQGRDVLARLVASDAIGPENRLHLAMAHHYLAVLLTNTATAEQALRNYQRAIYLFGRLVQEYPALSDYKEKLTDSLFGLGNVVEFLARPDAAHATWRRARDLQAGLAADPNNLRARHSLLKVTLRLGHFLAASNRHPDARKALTEAIEVGTELRNKGVKDIETTVIYASCFLFRARSFVATGHYREALADWDRFLAVAPPADRFIGRLYRADALAHLGDHRQAGAEARALARLKGWRPGDLYNLACVFALCSRAAASDHHYPLPRREADAEAHARSAVGLLRGAASGGYFRTAAARAHLAKDPDLDVLRQREDFRAFIATLSSVP